MKVQAMKTKRQCQPRSNVYGSACRSAAMKSMTDAAGRSYLACADCGRSIQSTYRAAAYRLMKNRGGRKPFAQPRSENRV